MSSVTIPSSVTSIGYDAFEKCTLSPLYLYAKLDSYDSCFEGLSLSSIIYAYGSEIDAIKAEWPGTVLDIETLTGIVEEAKVMPTRDVEGYYDLNGCKHRIPQRGINIVRYTNGTSRKIVVR